MNEVVNFRTELESKIDYSHENIVFYMDVELMFAEANEE
jgi:hypothetical protein